jgi:hypothetical protein
MGISVDPFERPTDQKVGRSSPSSDTNHSPTGELWFEATDPDAALDPAVVEPGPVGHHPGCDHCGSAIGTM